VARYLVTQGAEVTVTDSRTPEELAEPLGELAGLPIRYVLGRHAEPDFTPAGTDLVVRNPGVPRRAPLLELARSHGIPIEMEMSLFFRACPAPIVGVTGTKGKTTVATLIGELLRGTFPDAIVAGNMGISALDQLPRLRADVPVVVELSSWQLESLIEHGLAPAVAVLTLIAEDHLNTYDDFADYAATKRGITKHQTARDWLVVNRDDSEAWRAARETTATVVPFGARDRGADGAWLTGDGLRWRWDGEEWRWLLPQSPALAGPHGARNALAALAAAALAGADADAIGAGLAEFRGVPHRMEQVVEIAGVAYINDTTATAPIAAAAALAALAERPEVKRVHLLCGGADKRLDPAPLADAAARHGAAVYLFAGTATPALEAALRSRGISPLGPFASMAAAVAAARERVVSGDVVLLSPGCASFGLFRDEFDRGEQFREMVGMPSPPAPSPVELGVGLTTREVASREVHSPEPRSSAASPSPGSTGEGLG
jgi:UDP-N-acetylmuramoylalanine--D-glutamate ligase